MEKVIIHEFSPCIYPYKIWVAITSNVGELSDKFSTFDGNTLGEIKWGNIKLKHATTISVCSKDERGECGVLIVFYKRSSCTTKFITHEITHAVDYLWEYLGEDIPGKEANAYLSGWIAECIEKVKLNKE